MRQRTLVVIATAAATLGLALTASAAPQQQAERTGPPPSRVSLGGVVVDWDADGESLVLEEPEAYGGSRAVRRLIRSADEVTLDIGPRTRIVVEHDDGLRERIPVEELVEELELSLADLDVEAQGLVARGAHRRAAGPVHVSAKRIVLFLPGPDEADDESDLPDEGEPPAPGEDGPEPAER